MKAYLNYASKAEISINTTLKSWCQFLTLFVGELNCRDFVFLFEALSTTKSLVYVVNLIITPLMAIYADFGVWMGWHASEVPG